MKTYRVQQRQVDGVYRCLQFSGVKWTPWRTIAKYDTEPEAAAHFSRINGKGLRQTRIVHGVDLVKSNGATSWFEPADMKEHGRAIEGCDVADYCANCGYPFMDHYNSVCPDDK